MAKQAPMHPATLRVPTPLGLDLVLSAADGAIVGSRFCAPVPTAVHHRSHRSALLREAQGQVAAYFARRLYRFDLPLALEGTPFEVDAWRAVADLGFAEFVSYADIARAIGRPHAHRAVARAMAGTLLDLLIPAHRVIGADGQLKGVTRTSLRARLFRFESAPTASRSR
ncbi:MAG: methylated-DNA--[protein]-cysteine S-methyltransferase [Vulcanimicrobiaceae bacterium]